MNKTVLLDADVICHRMAYRNTKSFDFGDGPAEFLDPKQLIRDIDSELHSLVRRFAAKELIVCLSTRGTNFRKEIDPTYKATRKPKPVLWEEARKYLEEGQVDYQTVVMDRLEGDDVLGILATGTYKGSSVVVSIDKDMNTIPGLVFIDGKDKIPRNVSPKQAAVFHLSQVIVGDKADEYPGLRGAGPAFWDKLVAKWDNGSIPELWDLIVKAYESKGKTEDDAIHQARLAFILRDGFYNFKTAKVIGWKPEHYKDIK